MSEYHQQAQAIDAAAEPMVAQVAVLRERTNVLGREIREMRETQRREMEDLRASQKELGGKIDEVLARMAEAKGGMRVVCFLAGCAGTVGAAAVWLVQRLGGGA